MAARDDEAGNHKENVHSSMAARKPVGKGVKNKNSPDRERTETIDIKAAAGVVA